MDASLRILLVVTGDLELEALASSLSGLFPGVHFEARMTTGLTGPAGNSLRPPNRELGDAKGVDIITELLGAAIAPTPGAQGFDFAIALDDVELVNEAEAPTNPDAGIATIIDHIALSVDIALAQAHDPPAQQIPKGHASKDFRFTSNADRRKFLQERCSFHLLRPMVESLFFGDPAVIFPADHPRHAAIRFDPTEQDFEAFSTDDPDYLASPDGWIPAGARGAAPWAKANRRRHPKHYLQYLRDPTGTVRRPYSERKDGTSMLRALSWKQLVAPALHARMIRTFLNDIADMVGNRPPWLTAEALHPLTQNRPRGRLRNVP